jgi:hypothetical protein
VGIRPTRSRRGFRKIDEVAVPAYQEQERAKLRALVDERVALEEKRDAAQPS